MAKTCGGCRFWNQIGPERGACRRLPPVAVWGVNARGDQQPVTAWPETSETAWCGEHLCSLPPSAGGKLPKRQKRIL